MAGKDQITTDEWQDHWAHRKKLASWDYLSQIIFDILTFTAPREELRILEAGSGTGRISLRLAQNGADVTLVDISEAAQEISKSIFQSVGASGSFFRCSVMEMPFKDEEFDIVWNAGLLEHFEPHEQTSIVKEMARVCREEGLVIMFNPTGTALFFKIGLAISNLFKTWPYGYEAPISTVKNIVAPIDMDIVMEYKSGFFVLFVEGFRFIPGFTWVTTILRKLFISIHCSSLGGAMKRLDNFLARSLGGYLLVSVLRKKS